MADNNKKTGKTSGWVAVGDSMEGIKNLRPDVLKQTRENIKAIDKQIKQNGLPSGNTNKSKGK